MKKQRLLHIALSMIALTLVWGTLNVAHALETEVSHAAHLTDMRNPVVDKRAAKLEAFLATYNSPLSDAADTFVKEADKHNLDWRLVAAIAGTESTFGKHIPPGSYNAWGWGIPTGAQSGIGFANWEQGIATVSEGLAKNYYGRGARTLYEVGWIYAANGISWGNHVGFFLDKITEFTPTDPDFLAVTI